MVSYPPFVPAGEHRHLRPPDGGQFPPAVGTAFPAAEGGFFPKTPRPVRAAHKFPEYFSTFHVCN